MQIRPIKRVVDFDCVLLLNQKVVVEFVFVQEDAVRRLEGKIWEDGEFHRVHKLVT